MQLRIHLGHYGYVHYQLESEEYEIVNNAREFKLEGGGKAFIPMGNDSLFFVLQDTGLPNAITLKHYPEKQDKDDKEKKERKEKDYNNRIILL